MRECANCGAPLQEAQDWCLQCGTARAKRRGGAPGWLTGAAILATAVLLVAGASVAAYAALTKHKPHATHTLALRAPTTAVAPGGSSSVPPIGTTPTTPGAAKTPPLPTGTTPPKIPTQTPTPESSGGGGESANNLLFGSKSGNASKASKSSKATKSGGGSGNKGSTEGVSEGAGGEGSGSQGSGSKGSESQGGSGNGEGEAPAALLLDTNAASTYNPNTYPASLFGDPNLAIDGETSTAWTASMEAASAPHMAVGIVLDLRTAQKLGSIKVQAPTVGATAEIYGANGHTLPPAITDPGWKRLHGPRVLRKKSVTIKLKTKGAAYRFVLLWLVKAPPGSTPANPGHVAIAELELFPPT